MSSQPKPRLTPEEYLAIERAAEYKSEYYGGEMFAMSGTSIPHGAIACNLLAFLHTQLRGSKCRPLGADVRVHVPVTGLYTYPDVTVTCGDWQTQDAAFDTLLNPTFIAEILSPSTEAYDRGKKFEHYQSIESLTYYLLIAQDRIHVDLYTRQPDGAWLLTSTSDPNATLPLPVIGCTLPVSELYEGVEF